MSYKSLILWIFVVLILIVLFTMLFPTDWVIGIGMLLVPIIIGIQAYGILKAKEKKTKTFDDDQWYEH